MAYADAAAYAAQRGGTAFLVMVDGATVYEEYANGGSQTTAAHIHSATKPFWGPCAHKMVSEGHWASLDEPIATYIPAWGQVLPILRRDQIKYQTMTIRQLLWLTHGLIPDNDHIGGQAKNPVADNYRHVREYPTRWHRPRVSRYTPGTQFRYGPSAYYVIGEAMRQTLGADPLTFLEDNFLTPLDIEYDSWDTDSQGNTNMPNGVHLTARDWAKWMEYLRLNYEDIRVGSTPNSGHGHFTWLNTLDGFDNVGRSPVIYPDGHYDAFGGFGAGKNIGMVLPQLNMSVIRMAESNDPFDLWDFTAALLS